MLSPRFLDLLETSAGRFLIARLMRSPKQDRFIRSMRSFLPYMSGNPVFDDSATVAALRDTGIEVPSLESYLPQLLQHCVRQGWTRQSIQAAHGTVLQQFYDRLLRVVKRQAQAPASA